MIKNEILLIAHRGYSGKYPENSIQAYKAAFALPIWGIEVDIQKSLDNYYFLIHNRKILNSSNEYQKIDTLTKSEILQKTSLPELQELIDIRPDKYSINFELKWSLQQEDLPFISKMILASIPQKSVLISSFNHALLFYFKKQGFQIAMLVGSDNRNEKIVTIIKNLFYLNPQWINLPIELFELKSSFFIKLLLKVFSPFFNYAFYTVNSTKQLKDCQNYASAIFTDQIELMLKTL